MVRARYPSRSTDTHALHKAKDEAEQRVAKKRQQLQEVLSQHIAYQQLLERNRREPAFAEEQAKVAMPFIVCRTR